MIEELRLLGPMLIEQLTDPLVIALTRAAVVDLAETGTLAPLLNEQDKAMGVLIRQLIETGIRRNSLSASDVEDVVRTYSNVLFGDFQLQCVLGRRDAPDAQAREARAEQASALLMRLYG